MWGKEVWSPCEGERGSDRKVGSEGASSAAYRHGGVVFKGPRGRKETKDLDKGGGSIEASADVPVLHNRVLRENLRGCSRCRHDIVCRWRRTLQHEGEVLVGSRWKQRGGSSSEALKCGRCKYVLRNQWDSVRVNVME